MDAYGGFEALCLQADEGPSKTEECVVEYDCTLLACMLHLLVCEVGQGEEQGCKEADQEDALCCPDKLALSKQS